jgi:hypothetical protein
METKFDRNNTWKVNPKNRKRNRKLLPRNEEVFGQKRNGNLIETFQ